MDAVIVNRIISLISEAPADRSEEEIEEILLNLNSNTFALGEMSKNTLVNVFKQAKHMKLKKNRFLKKGTGSSDRLYIILTGGLSMFVEWQESVLPPILVRKDSRQNIRSVRQFGFRVDSIGPGEMIGDKNRMENVHMITDADTDLMFISRNLYESAVQGEIDRESETRDLFIKTHPFFSRWAEEQQNQIGAALVKKTYRNHEEIMKQGDPFSGLFFITKGRAILSAAPKRQMKQFEEIFEGTDMDKELEEIIKIYTPKKVDTMVSRGDTKGSHMDDITYVRRLDGYAAAEKREFDKVIDISVVSVGEILGDLELLLGLKLNLFSITSMGEGCEALVLNAKDIGRFLSPKRVPLTMKLMKLLAETKITTRMSSTQGQKVPIFPRVFFRLRQLRIKTTKGQLTISSNDVTTAKKPPKQGHHSKMEELDKNCLKRSFLKDKSPFLKPFTPGSVYYKEIMRQRTAARSQHKLQGQTEKHKSKEKSESPKDYHTIRKKIKESIAKSVKEGIRTEKVIKRFSSSWNKNIKLPKI